MNVAVLGGGAGGASAAVELTLAGHEVRLWNRSRATLEPFCAAGGIAHSGVLAGKADGLQIDSFTSIASIDDDLNHALAGADAALVVLPTMLHGAIAERLVKADWTGPIILNPGHTGGALEVKNTCDRLGAAIPQVAEFSTLTYVARKRDPGHVHISGCANRVNAACLPGGEDALALAIELYPSARPVRDVLATALTNVNMVLHPPGSVLGAAWVEATKGDFNFYVEGLGPGVGAVMEQLDEERRAVAHAFGHDLPSLFDEMQAIGTIEADAEPAKGLAHAIRNGTANAAIKAPDGFDHRYYLEDFWFGLMPFIALAKVAEVAVPAALALMELGRTLTGEQIRLRDAQAMGIEGMECQQLIDMVRD